MWNENGIPGGKIQWDLSFIWRVCLLKMQNKFFFHIFFSFFSKFFFSFLHNSFTTGTGFGMCCIKIRTYKRTLYQMCALKFEHINEHFIKCAHNVKNCKTIPNGFKLLIVNWELIFFYQNTEKGWPLKTKCFLV